MTTDDPQAPKSDLARRRRRPWLWLIGAALLSVAVIFVAWQVDLRDPPIVRAPRSGEPVTDLRPSALTAQEREGGGAGGGGGGALNAQAMATLEEGAWVQVAGPDGKVKQQYMAEQINPLPDRRLAMKQPRAVLYGTSGRVVTMRSDAMTASVPKGALESGRLEGNVVIRVYSPSGDRPVDLSSDAAEIVIEAPEAEFDMGAGEIRADRSVKVTSEAMSFVGEGLSLALTQDGRSIERLTVDRPLSPIRIERSAQILQERSRGLKPAQAGKTDEGQAAKPDERQAAKPSAPGAIARDRANGRDGASAGAGATRAPANEIRPYLLTIHDNVQVVSQEADRRIEMKGDQLLVTFTMETGVGDGLIAGAGADANPGANARGNATAQSGANELAMIPVAAPPGTLVMRPALMAVGHALAIHGAPASDAITIAYTGRLVLVPAESDTPPLPSQSAVRIEMLGKPATVHDSKSEAVLAGESVWFESETEQLRLTGTQARPASLESPDFAMQALALRMNRSTGLGQIDGAGSLRLGAIDKRPVNLKWSKEAEFHLQPGTQDAEGSLRDATFKGDVQVRSRDFALDSGTLMVEAEPSGKRDVLRRLVASDGVRASDLGARQGRLEANRVEMALAPDENGNAVPRTMHASGGVVVADLQQTIWAESLRTAFVAPKPGAGGAGVAGGAGGAGGASASKPGGASRSQDASVRADVGSIVAEGPVLLLLKDGTRVWASRLEGDAINGTARLTGPNVLVVRGNSVIDQLADLQVQEKPGKISVAGPGRVSYYNGRVLPESRAHMVRPTLLQVPVMQATWREGLAYVDGAVPGKLGAPDRGLLLLQGAVKMRASRSPLEAEALDADEVHIELEPQRTAGKKGGAGGASAAGDPASDMGALARMIARGNVRIETQEWRDAARSGEPRLFRLLSGNAMYDVAQGLCSVDGAGTILVHDPAAPAGVVAVEAKPSAFSPEGTTKFTWQRSLGMTSGENGLTTVALDGTVEMQHLGADAASSGTLASDHLEATVRSRPDRAAKPSDGAPLFGAGATLERILARGRVTVRTSEYDIEAGEFSLDEAKQIALLGSTPGRAVTIVKRGAETTRAESAEWDIAAGTVKVLKLRGTTPR